MAKYEVLRDCYGFQGRYWDKGTIVDLDPKTNPPHHFKRLDAPPETPKPEAAASGEAGKPAANTGPGPDPLESMSKKELLAEAEKLGIKNYKTLTSKGLKEAIRDKLK